MSRNDNKMDDKLIILPEKKSSNTFDDVDHDFTSRFIKLNKDNIIRILTKIFKAEQKRIKLSALLTDKLRCWNQTSANVLVANEIQINNKYDLQFRNAEITRDRKLARIPLSYQISAASAGFIRSLALAGIRSKNRHRLATSTGDMNDTRANDAQMQDNSEQKNAEALEVQFEYDRVIKQAQFTREAEILRAFSSYEEEISDYERNRGQDFASVVQDYKDQHANFEDAMFYRKFDGVVPALNDDPNIVYSADQRNRQQEERVKVAETRKEWKSLIASLQELGAKVNGLEDLDELLKNPKYFTDSMKKMHGECTCDVNSFPTLCFKINEISHTVPISRDSDKLAAPTDSFLRAQALVLEHGTFTFPETSPILATPTFKGSSAALRRSFDWMRENPERFHTNTSHPSRSSRKDNWGRERSDPDHDPFFVGTPHSPEAARFRGRSKTRGSWSRGRESFNTETSRAFKKDNSPRSGWNAERPISSYDSFSAATASKNPITDREDRFNRMAERRDRDSERVFKRSPSGREDGYADFDRPFHRDD